MKRCLLYHLKFQEEVGLSDRRSCSTLQLNMCPLTNTSEVSVPKGPSMFHQIQVCHSEQHAHIHNIQMAAITDEFLITDTLHLHIVVCSFPFDSCAFREDHHLLLQVKHCGQDFQRNASGPELDRVQLLPQVLQGRREGVPASGGNNYYWESGHRVRLKVYPPVSDSFKSHGSMCGIFLRSFELQLDLGLRLLVTCSSKKFGTHSNKPC